VFAKVPSLKKTKKVDEERTKSKIPHPNVHVEKGPSRR